MKMETVFIEETQSAVQLEGMDVRLIITGKTTDDSFSMVEYRLAAATLSAPIHRHTLEDIYLYVSEGELVVQFEGKMETVRSGQWLKIPRCKAHAVWSQPGTPARYIEVANPAGSEQSYLELGKLFALNKPMEYESIRSVEMKYGIETDFQSIFELTQLFGLRYDQRFQSICW
jgi:quercetin dioxygenase-like cupin family protein